MERCRSHKNSTEMEKLKPKLKTYYNMILVIWMLMVLNKYMGKESNLKLIIEINLKRWIRLMLNEKN